MIVQILNSPENYVGLFDGVNVIEEVAPACLALTNTGEVIPMFTSDDGRLALASEIDGYLCYCHIDSIEDFTTLFEEEEP